MIHLKPVSEYQDRLSGDATGARVYVHVVRVCTFTIPRRVIALRTRNTYEHFLSTLFLLVARPTANVCTVLVEWRRVTPGTPRMFQATHLTAFDTWKFVQRRIPMFCHIVVHWLVAINVTVCLFRESRDQE